MPLWSRPPSPMPPFHRVFSLGPQAARGELQRYIAFTPPHVDLRVGVAADTNRWMRPLPVSATAAARSARLNRVRSHVRRGVGARSPRQGKVTSTLQRGYAEPAALASALRGDTTLLLSRGPRGGCQRTIAMRRKSSPPGCR